MEVDREQRETFDDQGFLVLPGYLSATDLDMTDVEVERCDFLSEWGQRAGWAKGTAPGLIVGQRKTFLRFCWVWGCYWRWVMYIGGIERLFASSMVRLPTRGPH